MFNLASFRLYRSLAESDPTELKEIDAKLSSVLIKTTNKYYLCLNVAAKSVILTKK